MEEIRNTLERYADNASVEMVSCGQDGICLLITLPSRGNEKWHLLSREVVHIDMVTSSTLGLEKTKYGKLDLLAEEYSETRSLDFGGDKQNYRVINSSILRKRNTYWLFAVMSSTRKKMYNNHLQQARLQLSRQPYPLPHMKINPEVKSIFGFKYSDFELTAYQAHPHIKAEVSV